MFYMIKGNRSTTAGFDTLVDQRKDYMLKLDALDVVDRDMRKDLSYKRFKLCDQFPVNNM